MSVNIIKRVILLLGLTIVILGCNETEDNTLLKNDCLKWSLGPNVVGTDIEFTYAMAVPYNIGKITSAQVKASIAGAPETWMEHNSYHTDPDGEKDVPVLIGEPSVTEGNITKVNFTVDTCAAALRYYYRIPEKAKGKSISFTFSAIATTGENVSYEMGPYYISKMDMVRNLTLSKANCYISVEDMAVYNAEQAAAHPEKIDIVYLFRNYNKEGIDFFHAFVAPAADSKYLPDINLPAGVTRDTKIRKGGPLDAHLAQLHLESIENEQPDQKAVYVDDIDFITMDFTHMPNYALDMKKYEGFWVETEDGKYRAYIYINKTRNISGGTISMKRYAMK